MGNALDQGQVTNRPIESNANNLSSTALLNDSYKSGPAFPTAAESIFNSADTDGSGDLSLIELKAAELSFRGKDKVKERAANEMQADFQSIRKMDGQDGKDGISRSDLSSLRTNWKDISGETAMLRSLNEKNVQGLLTKVKPDGKVSKDDLEKTSTDPNLKLTAEQKSQLGYLIANYDQISVQANSKDSISSNDIVNYGMRRSVELPDVVGMESRLKDTIVTQIKTKTVEKKVYVQTERKEGIGRASGPLTGQPADVGGAIGAGAAAGGIARP